MMAEDKQQENYGRHWAFINNDQKVALEGRFWNCNGKQIAIVASVTRGDWAAYIGTDAPDSYSEEATCIYALHHGCKLSEKDARHYFPEIKMPYRG